MYLLSQGGNTLPTDENIAAAREAISQQMYDLSDPTVMKQLMTFAASVGMDYGTVIDNAVNHNAYYFEGQEQPDPNFNWIYETEPRNEAEEWLYQTLSDTFPEDAYFNDEAPTSDEQDQDAANDFFEDKSDSGPRPGEDKKDQAEASGMTREQIEELISDALSNLDIPSPRTDEEIQTLIEAAISAIPADTTRSDEDINNLISNAVSDFITASDLPEDQVRSDEDIKGLIDETIKQLPEMQEFLQGLQDATPPIVTGKQHC